MNLQWIREILVLIFNASVNIAICMHWGFWNLSQSNNFSQSIGSFWRSCITILCHMMQTKHSLNRRVHVVCATTSSKVLNSILTTQKRAFFGRPMVYIYQFLDAISIKNRYNDLCSLYMQWKLLSTFE